MGRTLMYTAIGGLLLIVLSATFVLDHGGGHIPVGGAVDSSAVAIVSMHDLTTSVGIQEYSGRNISTNGTLYFNSATNEYVITGGNTNYEIVIKWTGGLGQFEGQEVLVTGSFDLVPGTGPSIEATDVRRNVSVTPTPEDI